MDPITGTLSALGSLSELAPSASSTASGGSNYDDDYTSGSFNFAPNKIVNGVNFDPYTKGLDLKALLTLLIIGGGVVWYIAQSKK